MRIVVFGDSISFGQYIPSDKAWPSLLAKSTGHEVINASVCGETTRQALERFPRHVQDMRPKVVFIQFGLNDCNRWETDGGLPRVSRAAFRANLFEMVERARAFRVEPVICDLTPTMRSEQHQRDRNTYRRTAAIVAESEGVEFCRSALTADHLLDHVHLNHEGHQLFAEGAKRCLQQLDLA